MSYLKLSLPDRQLLRHNLRKLGIEYSYKQIKVKRIDGRYMTRKVADIQESHILKLIEAIKKLDTIKKDGKCRKIANLQMLRIAKKLLNEFKELQKETAN